MQRLLCSQRSLISRKMFALLSFDALTLMFSAALAPTIQTSLAGLLMLLIHMHCRAHEDDRSYCSLQNSQIFTLIQQLHDANNIMESRCSQVNALQSHLHKADHAHDPLKIEQKMLANMEQHSQCWTCPKHCI